MQVRIFVREVYVRIRTSRWFVSHVAGGGFLKPLRQGERFYKGERRERIVPVPTDCLSGNHVGEERGKVLPLGIVHCMHVQPTPACGYI